MSDFDHAIDIEQGEEYAPPVETSSSAPADLPPPSPMAWTPDRPAPLKTLDIAPGLFTTAGVEDAPSPLTSPQEMKQRTDEAALVAHGGQFTGDKPPTWSQSHMTKDPPPRQAFGDAFNDFHDHVTDTQQEYEDKLHYPAGLAGMVATGAVAAEDFAHGTVSTVRGASDHLESTMEAIKPIREGARPSAMLAIEEGSKTVGGLGQSVLDVTAVGAPIEGAMNDLGGGLSPAPAFAYATDGATEIDAGGASSVLDGPLERNTVKADSGRNGVRVGRSKDMAKRSEFRDLSEKAQEQQNAQNIESAQPHEPVKRPLPYQPIAGGEAAALEQKLEDRTMSREEFKRADWDRRLGNRRSKGVSRFWSEEMDRLGSGESGTRNWNEEQRQQIVDDEVPTDADGTPIEGHHRYNVNDYPQKAAEPGNIYPATKAEHLKRWHGGNWQNDTSGEPLNPDHKEEF